MKKKISTNNLINNLILNKHTCYEVSLNNGIFNATHFLRFGGKKIHDIGIDSKLCVWNKEEFSKMYPKAKWLIDQIVNPVNY